MSQEWLLGMSFREAEVAQHSQSQFSSKHLPQIRACSVRSLRGSISSATIFRQASPRFFSFLLQAVELALPPVLVASHTPGLIVGQTPALSACSYYKCLAQNFYVTSFLAPPMMCHFCQFPGIFHLLSPTIFSHGKSSLCCTDIRGGHPPSLVMSQVTIRSYRLRNVPQLIAIVIQSILNVSPTSAVPQLKGGRGFSPILGDPHCTPLQNHFSLDSISTISPKKVLIKITIYLQIVKSTCHFHILILLAL